MNEEKKYKSIFDPFRVSKEPITTLETIFNIICWIPALLGLGRSLYLFTQPIDAVSAILLILPGINILYILVHFIYFGLGISISLGLLLLKNAVIKGNNLIKSDNKQDKITLKVGILTAIVIISGIVVYYHFLGDELVLSDTMEIIKDIFIINFII